MDIPANDVGATSAEPGPRPATVVTATVLQGAAVVLLLAMVALAWLARAQHDSLVDEAARLVHAEPGEVEAEHSAGLAMAIATSVLAGLPALWLAATLWPMLRRSSVARILAAVAAFGIPGLGLLMVVGSCLMGFLFIGAIAGMPLGEPDPSGYGDVPGDPIDFPDGSPFQEKLWQLEGSSPTLSDALPLIVLVVMALLTAVAVLLVVPPTNRWYAPERAPRAGQPYPVYYPVYAAVPPYAAPQPGQPFTSPPGAPFTAPPATDHENGA